MIHAALMLNPGAGPCARGTRAAAGLALLVCERRCWPLPWMPALTRTPAARTPSHQQAMLNYLIGTVCVTTGAMAAAKWTIDRCDGRCPPGCCFGPMPAAALAAVAERVCSAAATVLSSCVRLPLARSPLLAQAPYVLCPSAASWPAAKQAASSTSSSPRRKRRRAPLPTASRPLRSRQRWEAGRSGMFLRAHAPACGPAVLGALQRAVRARSLGIKSTQHTQAIELHPRRR